MTSRLELARWSHLRQAKAASESAESLKLESFVVLRVLRADLLRTPVGTLGHRLGHKLVTAGLLVGG